MALTLLESAKTSQDDLQTAVTRLIVEHSPVLQVLPQKTVTGNSYAYNIQQALPGIAFRGVGETYNRSTGIINPVVERLVIMGGEIFLDNFQIRTQGDVIDLKAEQWEMKSQAFTIAFSEIGRAHV